MNRAEAEQVSKMIEDLLVKYDIHYKNERVNSPTLKFINITISIKITK